MKEHNTRLSRSLIVGHGRDGRCLYDPEAKRELAEICWQPGISVAKVALEHGINANLLRKWMERYRDQGHSTLNSPCQTALKTSKLCCLGASANQRLNFFKIQQRCL